MDVSRAIKERYSVRAYKNKEIPTDSLNKILESARLAPSASNRQQWKFIVIRDPDRRKALARAAANQEFVGEAPVVIAAVSLDPVHIMRCGVPEYAVDIAIAIDHMTLQAVELGLGSCWICAFSQEEVKRILNIPDKYKVVALLPIGYPSDTPSPKIRKSIKEVVCYETFPQDPVDK